MFKRLAGLPPYGPQPRLIPDGWGRGVREGVVVEFRRADGTTWVGNFEPGIRGVDDVRWHPNGLDILVTANGQMYRVDPASERCALVASAICGLWLYSDPPCLLLSDQDCAFFSVGPRGLLWSTRRISFDGFQNISVHSDSVEGEAWSPTDCRWHPFRVDLTDGSVIGGSYNGPEMRFDRSGFTPSP